MNSRSQAIHKRAVMRDCMRRITKISAECGIEAEMAAEDNGDVDDFTLLVRRINRQVEEIKKDARAKTRVSDSSSATENVALSHEIRRKHVALREDVDKMKGMLTDMQAEIEKKKEKAKGKPKRLAEINSLETKLTQRNVMKADTVDAVASLDILIGKVLQVSTEKDERRLQAANSRPSQHRKLKLMDNALKADGTFERPEAAPQEEIDEETAALFQAVDAKQQKISAAMDVISKQLKGLKQQALAMGTEVQAQNLMLNATEKKMDHLEGELATLTLRVGKFSKEVRGSNMCLGVCCVLLLLALVGYILSMLIPDLIPK